jgi:glyoxylase-like metal-dependent hydrolase (beta-lactamase superfamily II)
MEMEEVLPGIHQWSWFSPEKGYNFNGYLVVSGKERVLIDPPPMAEEDAAWLDRQGPITGIVLTNHDHVREAETDRKRYNTLVSAPEADAPLMEIKADRTFTDGDRIPGGLKVIHVPDGKSPGESALLLERGKGILFLGDALIGKPPGRLSLMPPEKYKDPLKAREGIRALLRQSFDSVLVGDGASILAGGRKAIEDFLRP